MDRCRENQGWTTACSGIPERDGKNQEEDRPKQAGSCWFARPCWLATSGANLYPPGVWVADDMAFFLWCEVCFVLLRFSSPLCFRWSRGPSFDRPSICRRSDSHTCFFLSFFPFFLFIWRCRFFRVFSRFLLVWRVRRTFFPSGWCFFYLVTTGWIFDISLCENLINQSIKVYFCQLISKLKFTTRQSTQLFTEVYSFILLIVYSCLGYHFARPFEHLD